MKRGLAVCAVFFCAFLCGFGARAETIELSFDRAVAMIMKESQDLKKADANLRKAEAGRDAVNANRWFKLDGSATYMNLINVEHPGNPAVITLPPELIGMTGGMIPPVLEMPDNMFMAGVTASQPLYTFGKIGNALDSARVAISMAQSGKEVASREVRYAAAQLYWTTKMADNAVRIAQNSYDKTNEAKRLLTSAGRPNRSNLIKIEADVAAQSVALSNAKFNRDSAIWMLKAMAGIDDADNVVLTTDFPNKFGALPAQKLDSNPEWDLYEKQAKMYEASAKSRRAARAPTLAAMASYNYVAMGNNYKLWEGSKSQTAYWGLSLSVPIWDGMAARANATLDAMDAEAARQDLDKSKKMKTNEFNTAVARHKHLIGNLSSLQNARDLAAKAYDISKSRFAAGQTSAVELAEVQGALSQMEMSVLSAKMDILMAEESVRKLGTSN